MGKLHKIRREIARNPDRWMEVLPRYGLATRSFLACSAAKSTTGAWYPSVYGNAYRAFVRKTLRDLGKRVS